MNAQLYHNFIGADISKSDFHVGVHGMKIWFCRKVKDGHAAAGVVGCYPAYWNQTAEFTATSSGAK